MKMVRCNSCGDSLWDTTAQCAICGSKRRATRARAEGSGRDVSVLWLLTFGFFYLYYKGWHKAGAVHMFLCFFLMGTMWIAIPFRAKQFVDYFEDL